MDARELPILCNQLLHKQRHVCAIFNDRGEAREIVSEFLAEGCKRGHQSIALVDPLRTHETVEDVESCGININAALGSGHLVIRNWQDAYLREGRFRPQAMLEYVASAMSSAHEAGYSSVWATGDMSWASRDEYTGVDLVEYEALLNEIKPDYSEDVWVCFYDASLFNGRVIADVVRAHPVILMGRHVFENPCYTSPRDLVPELHQWRKKLSEKTDCLQSILE